MICWFESAGNNVQFNNTNCILLSSIFSNKHGLVLKEANKDRIISIFISRSLIQQNWIKDQDRYLAPNGDKIK